jgi:uncharacterized protein
MSFGSDWRVAVTEYIRAQAQPKDKYGHQPRLYALTRVIGADHAYDDDVVFAAAWMHDIGVFVGHRPDNPEALAVWDNVAYATVVAPGLLVQFVFPKTKISSVVEAIRTHQLTQAPQTFEGLILRDADILKQLGAIGILRAVCKVGRDTRYSTFSEVVPALETAMKNLPSLLRLPSTQALAESRISILR